MGHLGRVTTSRSRAEKLNLMLTLQPRFELSPGLGLDQASAGRHAPHQYQVAIIFIPVVNDSEEVPPTPPYSPSRTMPTLYSCTDGTTTWNGTLESNRHTSEVKPLGQTSFTGNSSLKQINGVLFYLLTFTDVRRNVELKNLSAATAGAVQTASPPAGAILKAAG
ncbi:hypothetical protein SISNIDRAFT_490749 [Sistotremastrum niveocremeum HHB9708]|uniref:Uncharacterized protein n=1 Tax=Sistotremastrum niveocremeum HHB9708 TaxID=1314777 RepID=A0A164NK12_9AGAM|nr:hypothetical protein SISNIDRAFT_490749 [Sistotremastrum niveocremeum HHB9708]